MNPLDHIVKLAKGGNQGALASLKELAKGGHEAAATALSQMGDENGSKGEEPAGPIAKSFDADALRKSMGEILGDVDGEADPALVSPPADAIQKGASKVAKAPEADDDEDENFEFDFDVDDDDEDDAVTKSLAATNDRLDRLTKGVAGTGYGVLDLREAVIKSSAEIGEVKEMLGRLLKGLKRPATPAGVVQPGQVPASKPIGMQKSGGGTMGDLRKSLQDRIESAEAGSPDWLAAMTALDDLTVGNANTARALLQGS